MKNLIFLLLATTLIVSCSSDDNNNDDNYYNLQTGIDFLVSNQNGDDLLNPNTTNAYSAESIKIFYLKDGIVEEIYNSNLALPRNFKIVSPEDSGEETYFMRIFLNNFVSENAITYIEWNETDTDTIRANFNNGDNYSILSKAWYNEELVFDETINTLPIIIKN